MGKLDHTMMRQIVSGACGLLLCLGTAAVAQDQPPEAVQDAAPSMAAPPTDKIAEPPPTARPAPSGNAGADPAAAKARTEDQMGIVVELYTSQGCSSCPPADRLFEKLAAIPGVIPLALHVDYWDYIGWKDTFAAPGFTERQKAYARAAGERMIYTPQIIVEGADRLVGNEPEALRSALSRVTGKPGPVHLVLERQGDRIVIRADADPPLSQGVIVQLVRYQPQQTVEIAGGENMGEIVTYSNIVTDWQRVGEWPGTAPLEMVADAPGPAPVVVILQNPGPAGIVAAARLR
jgi:hypothetical protein